MRYGISDFSDIKFNASHMANAIFSENEDGMDMVIDSLISTASSQAKYTRSLTLVAQHIHQTLQSAGALKLADGFRLRFADEAIATYFDFWLEYLGHTPKDYSSHYAADFIDPAAISSFTGDLYSSSLISFRAFELCVNLLLATGPSTTLKVQLRSLYMLIARGCAYRQPEMTSGFLYKCLDTVRTSCQRAFGFLTIEEQRLKELLYDLRYCGPTTVYPNVIDWRLDLSNALMSSVCVPFTQLAHPRFEVEATPARRISAPVPALRQRDEKDAYITFAQPPISPKQLARGGRSDSDSDSDEVGARDTRLTLHTPQPVRAFVAVDV